MKRLLAGILALTLSALAIAQNQPITQRPVGIRLSSIGSAITTGCTTANAVLYNASTPCSANLTFDGTTLTLGTDVLFKRIAARVLGIQASGAAATLRVYDGTPTNYIALSHDGTDSTLATNAGGMYFQPGGQNKFNLVSTAGAGASITAGTATTDVNALSTTQTWNEGSTTFTGKDTNITSTASATLSQVERWRVGGTAVAGIVKDGSVYGTLGFWKSAATSYNGANYHGLSFAQGDTVALYTGFTGVSDAHFALTSTSTTLALAKVGSASGFGFGSTSAATSSADTIISRGAAGVVYVGLTAPGQRTGTIRAAVTGVSCTTVAALPAGTQGDFACVTDQTAACPVAGAALTGGGAVICPVFYNGSAWTGG